MVEKFLFSDVVVFGYSLSTFAHNTERNTQLLFGFYRIPQSLRSYFNGKNVCVRTQVLKLMLLMLIGVRSVWRYATEIYCLR